MKSRAQFMKELETEFKCKFVSESEGFDGSEGGIWLSAEEPGEMGGLPLFDYWATNTQFYDGGVLRKFREYLDKAGWHNEYHDPGTTFLWRN